MKHLSTVVILALCVLICSAKINNLNHRTKRYVSPIKAQISKMKTCDQSAIPVLDKFNISKLEGDWYELGKSMSSYIDVNDGMWKIMKDPTNSNGYKFLYSGRNSDEHCIKPIFGTIVPNGETPGELLLNYKTFTTTVSEKIRILYTDYTFVAVLYSCMHVNERTGGCHPAGVLGSLWTRKPHVSGRVYDEALKYIQQACIDPHIIKIRNIIGPCQIDNLEIDNENENVPDKCYQPLSSGSCSANLQRFYYEKKLKQCTNFTYGGCDGNSNNFLSRQECEQQCSNVGENIYPDCAEISSCALHCPPCCQQKEDGCVSCNCDSIIVDEALECMDSQDCPSNCQGKEIYPNCFQCICPKDRKNENDIPSVCLEPKQVGTCKDKIERYYYNTVTKNCEKFTFSGCGQNKNNFVSIVECIKSCQGVYHQETIIKTVDDNDGASENSVQISLLICAFITIWYNMT